MFTTSVQPLAILLVALGLLLFVKVAKVGSRPDGLPPGPPTIPLLGNLHLMTSYRPYTQMQKWAQEYGPIYSLILGTRIMIVLSSDKVSRELLDKRGGNYSDRPDTFIGQKIASGNNRLVLMRYGDQWRMIHKMIHNILNIKAAVHYVPYQDIETRFLLSELVESPKDFLQHIRRTTYSISTQMIFGYRCINNKDPNLLQLFENFFKWSEVAGSSSAQLVDLYPFLQKIPSFIAPNVSYAKKLYKAESAVYIGHWLRSKEALDKGTSLPCFCNDIYSAQKKEGFSDPLAGYISGTLLEAGSDTTASTLYGFVQAMLLYPEVMRKAQDELDRVVGPDRMPMMEDYDDLPYIRCCIKESVRWMPTVILGVPHASLKDDTYQGYTIPKGAAIVNNVWAINMDPERYHNPRAFDPDRYEGDNTSLYQSAVGDSTQRDAYGFGAGRRMCQGIHIAERTLFLAISRLLWGFDFSPAKDPKGQPVEYDTEDFVGGLVVQPADYQAHIEPRSQDKVRIIRETLDEGNKQLDPVTLQWKQVPEGMAFYK